MTIYDLRLFVLPFFALSTIYLTTSCKTTNRQGESAAKSTFVKVDYGVSIEGKPCNVEEQRENFTEKVLMVRVVCYPASLWAQGRQCSINWSPGTPSGSMGIRISEFGQDGEAEVQRNLLDKAGYSVKQSNIGESAQTLMDELCTQNHATVSTTSYRTYTDRLNALGIGCKWQEKLENNYLMVISVKCYTPRGKQCNIYWTSGNGYAQFNLKLYDNPSLDRTLQVVAFDDSRNSVAQTEFQSVAQDWLDKHCHD